MPTSSSSLSRLNQRRHWSFPSLHPSRSSASSFSSLFLRDPRLRLHLHLQRSAASRLRRRQHSQQRRLLKLAAHSFAPMEDLPTISETPISESYSDPRPRVPEVRRSVLLPATLNRNQTELLRALHVAERDSVAIAECATSLFASLRLALSEATGSPVVSIICGASVMLQAASRNQRLMQLQRVAGEEDGLFFEPAHVSIGSGLGLEHQARAYDGVRVRGLSKMMDMGLVGSLSPVALRKGFMPPVLLTLMAHTHSRIAIWPLHS